MRPASSFGKRKRGSLPSASVRRARSVVRRSRSHPDHAHLALDPRHLGHAERVNFRGVQSSWSCSAAAVGVERFAIRQFPNAIIRRRHREERGEIIDQLLVGGINLLPDRSFHLLLEIGALFVRSICRSWRRASLNEVARIFSAGGCATNSFISFKTLSTTKRGGDDFFLLADLRDLRAPGRTSSAARGAVARSTRNRAAPRRRCVFAMKDGN